MWVRKEKKKRRFQNGTIHREATCHAEERETKDDRRKEQGQRVDSWSNQCGTGSVVATQNVQCAQKVNSHATLDAFFFWLLWLLFCRENTGWEELWVNSVEGFS